MTQKEFKDLVRDLPKEFDTSEVVVRESPHGPDGSIAGITTSYHELGGLPPVVPSRGSHPQFRRVLVLNIGG